MSNTLYLSDFRSDDLITVICQFERYIKETDRGNSVRYYIGDVKRFCEWIVKKYGDFKAHTISALDIVEYRRFLQKHGGRKKNGLAPASVNRALISLRIFFTWLKKQGRINDNPALDIKPVAIAFITSPKWLTRSQQAALMRSVLDSRKIRDEAIIGLMLHAGLRVSELCSLEREDIFLAARNGKVCVTGKGNKYREVPLNSTIRKIVHRLLEQFPTGPLFSNRYGKPISTRGVFKLVKEYAYKSKLESVTPHTLRHTFCKNAIDMGIPIDQVAAMAGHSSLDVTKRYTAPSQNDLQSAVERLAWE